MSSRTFLAQHRMLSISLAAVVFLLAVFSFNRVALPKSSSVALVSQFKSTAHCLGRIEDTAGNIIVDLGTVATYTALFPQNSNHQDKCVQDVSTSASSWLSNSGQMCHAFLAANGGSLEFHYKLGSLPWRASGHATAPDSYNYPKSCFGPTGTAFPSYYIISLIYTPPGCTPSSTGYNCGSGSFVSYGSGSSTGSTVSIEKSIEGGSSLTATLGALGAGASYSQTLASGSSVTISKKADHLVKWPDPGPVGPDGINHDYDQFLVLLNPAVAISGWHDPVTGQNHVQWSFGTKNGQAMRIKRVQVSYLRCALAGIGPRPGNSGDGGNPSMYDPGSCLANPFLQMPAPADASAPNGWLPGLTYDDYKQILDQDLFWNASTNPILIPTSRFVPQLTDFMYDKAAAFNGTSCLVQTQSISNSNTATNTSSTQNQYKTSMSVSPNFPLVAAMLNLSVTNSFTWTNRTSNSLTTADSQTATATVACTSLNWTGPSFVTAYYDTLYGTFLFALDDGTGRARILHGTITDMDGSLVPHEPLKLVVGNKTYQTFSSNNGSYRFLLPIGQTSAGAPTGTLFVGSTGAISKAVSVGPDATTNVTIPTKTPPKQSEICVVKFADNNSNGRQDADEQPLPGWSFQIKDASQNIVATITTDVPQNSCAVVPAPGTYTISEVLQPGWITTTQNPRTVTISGDSPVNLSFGNKLINCGSITFNPAAGLLPASVINTPYSQAFTATGGCASSFTYSVTGGTLPPGLTISTNGVLSGAATQAGDFSFSVKATDSCGCSRTQNYTMRVQSATNTAGTKTLVISAFRENGPKGPGDEFIEIFNPSNLPVTINSLSRDPNGPEIGIGVFSSDGNGTASNSVSLRCLIPGATVIKGRGWYLCGGSQYSLSNLGGNGGTFHSVPDSTIIGDIPNDAGLALLNIGTATVTACTITAATGNCPTGFNYAGGNARVFDKVGFRPYRPTAPTPNTYPSRASNYCEGSCLQPVGDASTLTLTSASLACPSSVGPVNVSGPTDPVPPFPVHSGGFIGGVPVCYGESGQYLMVRRRSGQQFEGTAGNLHRDTDNNADDFILDAPNPSTGNVGQGITGVSGVSSVLGAAGPHSRSAPPMIGAVIHAQDGFDVCAGAIKPCASGALSPRNAERRYQPDPGIVNVQNDPFGTFILRRRFINFIGSTTGARYRIDDLSTLCGGQVGVNGTISAIATQEARNLRGTNPTCQGEGSEMGVFTALFKAVNHGQEIMVDSAGVARTVLGTVLEDMSTTGAGMPAVSSHQPFGGGNHSSFVATTLAIPSGDGVTGGNGSFRIITGPQGATFRIAFKFGVVKSGRFKLLLGTEVESSQPPAP